MKLDEKKSAVMKWLVSMSEDNLRRITHLVILSYG